MRLCHQLIKRSFEPPKWANITLPGNECASLNSLEQAYLVSKVKYRYLKHLKKKLNSLFFACLFLITKIQKNTLAKEWSI